MSTLLDAVNRTLKRAKVLDENQTLTSISESSKQGWIDVAIQVINETILELYDMASLPKPNGLGEATITLATADRDYALNASLTKLFWPFIDETNGATIYEWRGGYLDLVESQLQPANFTGLALWACIRPTDGQLYLDRIPTSAENGKIYKYRYETSILLAAATDTLPFNDSVLTAVTPAFTEKWRSEIQNQFNAGMWGHHMAMAVRYLTKSPQSGSWLDG